MVTQSQTPQAPSTAVGFAISSDKAVPVLRGEIRYPKLSGHIHRHFYTAMDVKLVIEVEPKVPPVGKKPERERLDFRRPQRNPELLPSHATEQSDGMYGWKLVGAGALFLTATILTDFVFGIGIFDDLVTIPAALATMGRGACQVIFPVMLRGGGALAGGMVLKAAH